LKQIPVSYHALLDGDLLNESSRSCFPTWRGLNSRTALWWNSASSSASLNGFLVSRSWITHRCAAIWGSMTVLTL
jgi:hypothetical protein